MLTIISKKAFRFPKPGAGLLQEDSTSLGKQLKFGDMYFDTKPGAEGKFGDPQEAPDWIKKDITWERAVKDGDLAEISVKAGSLATDKNVLAAQKQAEASQARAAQDQADLDNMTKAELVAHAKDVHGVDLDEGQTKAQMIAQVEAEREKKVV